MLLYFCRCVSYLLPLSRSLPLLLFPNSRCLSHQVLFYCHFPDSLLSARTSALKRLYRLPFDWLEEVTTGAADRILVNSSFTAGVFRATFRRLHARGVQPAVLYPSINFDKYDEKKKKTKEEASKASQAGRAAEDEAGDEALLNAKLDASVSLLLSINRFERKKNIELALRALALVVQPALSSSSSSSAAADASAGNAASPASSSTLGAVAYGMPASASSTSSSSSSAAACLLPSSHFVDAELSATRISPQPADKVKLVVAGGYDPLVRENVEYHLQLVDLGTGGAAGRRRAAGAGACL